MKASIVPVGNSKGIRIPKELLIKSGLSGDVELKAKTGEIRIVAPKTKDLAEAEKIKAMMRAYGPSYSALARDWDRPEEEAAWADLQ